MSSLFEVTRSVAWVLQKDEGGIYPFDFIVAADAPLYYEDAKKEGGFPFLLPYMAYLEKGGCADSSRCEQPGHKHYVQWRIEDPKDYERVTNATEVLSILNNAYTIRRPHIPIEPLDNKRVNTIITREHAELMGDGTRHLYPIKWAASFIHLFAGYRFIQPIIENPGALTQLLIEGFMWEDRLDRYDQLQRTLASLR